MPKTNKLENRHPVDMLSDVRDRIKALEADEKALRALIIESGDTVGDDNVAMIKDPLVIH